MAMTDERSAERANGERGKAVDAAILAIEKQFARRDHEAHRTSDSRSI